MDLDMEAVVRTFLAESEEGLRAMEEALVALEGQPDDEELLQTIFRVTHTLKGNAGSLGFQNVAGLAHVLEDLLHGVRERTSPVTPSLVTLLLQCVDALREMVPETAGGAEGMRPEHALLIERVARARQAPSEQGGTPGFTPGVPAPRWRSHGRRRTDFETEREKTLRVDIDKLDQMLTLAGEIAVARGRLAQMLETLGGPAAEELLEAHHEADRVCLDLQEQVMKARMVPVGPTFRQHIRAVRDVAVAHGKLARLLVEGEEVEVDTRVIEHLRGLLTHMVRNAVDHGIEAPEVRRVRGKDPCGLITLRALHDAGSIVIQLEDDGSGFDRRRIEDRARDLGLVEKPEGLSEDELFRLVLEPGFSTAESVTEISGRGVGMDVVRRGVEALRGSLAIASREGAGTSITIRLPLTLAIIEGFGVGVGAETYVIPLDAVVECVELPQDEHARSEGRGVISLRGEPLPYLRLRGLFGALGQTPARESIVVVQYGAGRAGLAVDALYGDRQTVIKPLGGLFQRVSGVSGSAILGSGRVALILDIPALFREVLGRGGAPPDTGRAA